MSSITAIPVAARPARQAFVRLPFTRRRRCRAVAPCWLTLRRRPGIEQALAQAAAGERARILQDLHDGCGGQLAMALRLAHEGADPGRIAEALRDCIDELRLTLDGCDRSCPDLGPLLAAQRERLERRLAGSSLELRWELDLSVDLRPRSQDHGLQVLRIVQEAVTNVLKHAGAKVVRVVGGVDGERQPVLRLVIRDDGVGFRPLRSGRGLAGMRRRAALIGATLSWQAADPLTGCGTEVELHLPLRPG